MKFPTKLKIGPHTTAVRIVSSIRAPWNGEVTDLSGRNAGSEGVIDIARYNNAERRWSVLMHEVLHEMSNNLPPSLWLSEDQVSGLAPYLALFLRENGFLEVEPFDLEEALAHAEAADALRSEFETVEL